MTASAERRLIPAWELEPGRYPIKELVNGDKEKPLLFLEDGRGVWVNSLSGELRHQLKQDPSRAEDLLERYLAELCVEHRGWRSGKPVVHTKVESVKLRKQRETAAVVWKKGDLVMHESFGEGEVIDVYGSNTKRQSIAVRFSGMGPKILDPQLAPIWKQAPPAKRTNVFATPKPEEDPFAQLDHLLTEIKQEEQQEQSTEVEQIQQSYGYEPQPAAAPAFSVAPDDEDPVIRPDGTFRFKGALFSTREECMLAKALMELGARAVASNSSMLLQQSNKLHRKPDLLVFHQVDGRMVFGIAEVDGSSHEGRWANDQARHHELQAAGFLCIRHYTAEEVFRDPMATAKDFLTFLEQFVPMAQPVSPGVV